MDRGATGANLVTNGDFAVSTGWNFRTGFAYNGATFKADGTAATGDFYRGISLVAGRNYLCKSTLSNYTGGSYRINIGGSSVTGALTTSYFNVINCVSTNGNYYIEAMSAFTGSLDDLSVVQLGCVLDLNASGLSASTSGYWYDRTNSTAASSYTSVAATNTNCSVVVPPASNLSATAFNGSTSNIAFTGMNGLTGDITFSAIIRLNSFGEENAGRIFHTTKFQVFPYVTYLAFRRSGSTIAGSSASSIIINTDYHIIITSTAAGVTNIYINGVLNGTANQSAGTPESDTTWHIGDIGDGSRVSDGRFSNINIWSRILSQDEITLVKDTNF